MAELIHAHFTTDSPLTENENCHLVGGRDLTYPTQNPVRKNLEFFIGLRNKIEHHSMPEIDSDIFGECQAMLFNFDEFISEKFGKQFAWRSQQSNATG